VNPIPASGQLTAPQGKSPERAAVDAESLNRNIGGCSNRMGLASTRCVKCGLIQGARPTCKSCVAVLC